MHCISGPYNWVHPLNFRADMHTGVCGVPCMPISWRWQKHKQFALWPKNLTDVFQLQDKASPVELIREKREGESPPSHGYTPGTGISVDVVCELVTREIASKQTTESSPDNTWKRGGRCVCVCVCRRYAFIPLCTAVCVLISHQHMRGFPASSRPFEILPACLFMSSTRVFQGLHLFFPFPEFPFSFASKEFGNDSPPPPERHAHTFTLALWRGLSEVIRTISCITINVVWHGKQHCNMIKHSWDNSLN